MTHEQFLEVMQKRIASGAVTPSAARNMGPRGTVRAARKFLADKIALRDVGASGQNYPQLLDGLTRRLVRTLPKQAQHWGAARKFLNIFLRDAAYNIYLRSAYRLDRIENQLEVPLDSHMARELKQAMRNLNINNPSLPRWKTVISIDSRINKRYQDVARKIARRERIDPVHLDVIAWRKSSGYL